MQKDITDRLFSCRLAALLARVSVRVSSAKASASSWELPAPRRLVDMTNAFFM